LYECETLSLALKEVHKWTGVLKTGSWGEYLDPRGRNLREAEGDCIMKMVITCTLHEMLLSMWWVGHVVLMGEMRNSYKILVENLKRIDQT